MRSKLLILILFISSLATAQTKVPNTATFSLTDVCDVIYGNHNAGKSLSGCFSSANSTYFDATYNTNSYAPANSLLRFRNYGFSGNICTTGTYRELVYSDGSLGTIVPLSTKTLACDSRNTFICSGDGHLFINTYSSDWEAGSQIFKSVSSNCVPMQDTWAYHTPNWDYPDHDYVYHIVGGVIVSKETCPTSPNTISLSTNSATAITTTTATSGVYVTNVYCTNLAKVTGIGVCWNTTGSPVYTDSHLQTNDGDNGIHTGNYSYNLTGLTPNTTYYLRGFAHDYQATGYGNEISFTTSGGSVTVPSLTTTFFAMFGSTNNVSVEGSVTSNGGATITEMGGCWSSTNPNPTKSNSYSAFSWQVQSGSFGDSLRQPAFTPCTTYYARAYATNSAGTGYGDVKTFTYFCANTAPTVTTTSITSITSVSASSGGNATSDGGTTITDRGICWSTSTNPIYSDSKISSGTGTGSFTANLSGLYASTSYHVRAYAVNSVGVSYGSDVSFTTSASVNNPSVTTSLAEMDINGLLTAEGNIDYDGCATITAKGFVYSTSNTTPTLTNSSFTGSGSGSSYSGTISLLLHRNFYVRAYATNSSGTSYGATITANSDISIQ